jgi:hypothetical protein
MQNDLLPQRPFTIPSAHRSFPRNADLAARAPVDHRLSAIQQKNAHMSAQLSRRIATTLSMIGRLATAAALRFWKAYIRAMHESRRREAAMLVALHCPDVDPAEFMRGEYGVGAPERRRRDGPLSDAEIAFLKSHSKASD